MGGLIAQANKNSGESEGDSHAYIKRKLCGRCKSIWEKS